MAAYDRDSFRQPSEVSDARRILSPGKSNLGKFREIRCHHGSHWSTIWWKDNLPGFPCWSISSDLSKLASAPFVQGWAGPRDDNAYWLVPPGSEVRNGLSVYPLSEVQVEPTYNSELLWSVLGNDTNFPLSLMTGTGKCIPYKQICCSSYLYKCIINDITYKQIHQMWFHITPKRSYCAYVCCDEQCVSSYDQLNSSGYWIIKWYAFAYGANNFHSLS